MSWLARSIANTLLIDDDDDDGGSDGKADRHRNATINSPSNGRGNDDEQEEEREREREMSDHHRREGVRDDLSEFTETLTRQLWGVASFLAPPPEPSSTTTFHAQSDPSVPDRDRRDSSVSGDFDDDDAGNHGDFSGRFGAGNEISDLPNLSNNNTFRSEDEIRDDHEAIGVKEEVLTFASNIAHHPETWLDFPLSEEEDIDDFDMSDTQWNHVTAVERLAPRLAALRIELCPTHMRESYFWKVYFVLLHSRLNKHDAELLSTPQIVAARAMWMQELHKCTKPEEDWSGRSTSHTEESTSSPHADFHPTSSDFPSGNMSHRSYAFEHTSHDRTTNFETHKHPVLSSENHIVDKSVIKEEGVLKTKDQLRMAGPSFKVPVIQEYDDDGDDDWLKESSDVEGYVGSRIPVEVDEDVSFSDLEDDEDCTMPIKSMAVSKDLMSPKKL